MAFITFIIPSVNRPVLIQSIKSLGEQEDSDWECVIVFDGLKYALEIPKNLKHLKHKIKVINCSHKGEPGLVRNEGFSYINSEWVGFLDDDDTLLPTYVSNLKQIVKKDAELQAVHFRMKYSNGVLKPGIYGISYAVKTNLIRNHNIKYDTGRGEDYRFFKSCQKVGKSIMVEDAQYIIHKVSGWKREVKMTLL